MKTILLFSMAFLFLIIGCAPMNSNLGIRQTYRYPEPAVLVKAKMPSLSEILSVPTQRFIVHSDTMITGLKGTEIQIYPGCLYTAENNPVHTPIYIELKELYSKGDLIKEKAGTISNGALLESDGSLYLAAYDADGRELTIVCDGAITVSIPRTIEEGMTWFDGHRDSLGNMNWDLSDSVFSISQNAEGYNGDEYYGEDGENWKPTDFQTGEVAATQNYLFTTRKFGWINCDRFYEDPREKTDLIVQTGKLSSEKISEAYAYLVFDSLQSVIPAYPDEKGQWNIASVPVGEPVTFLTIQKAGETIYYGSRKLEAGNSVEEIKLHAITREDLTKILEITL